MKTSKLIVFVLVFSFFLAGCTELTGLKRVRGKTAFELANNLDCQILTTTDDTKFEGIAKKFKLLSLDRGERTIVFKTSPEISLQLFKIEEAEKMNSYFAISKELGTFMFILEKSSGVIAMVRSMNGKFEEEQEVVAKGNCLQIAE